MAKERVIGFKINIEGSEQIVKTIAELEKVVRDTNKELKNTEVGTARYKELNTQLADAKGQLQDVRKEQRTFVKEAQGARAAEGSYKQLNARLISLKNDFRNLGKEAREGIAGQQLINQIQELDAELKDLDKTIGQSFRNVGNYSSAFDGLGASIGGGISGIASFAFGAAGLGAAGDLIIQGAEAVAELTEQFRVLRGEIERLTGATGAQLDSFTSSISGIATTFQVETDEVLQAANTLSKELGIGFGEALTAVEKGFVAGANANGEFLDSLREYSTQARAAGLDTAEFISILNQSAREGVFSDKGIDTVKEFGLRIREQTTATQAALTDAFGEQFANDLFKQLNTGAISTVDALKQVVGQIKASEIPANKLQTVIADVFGGPGEDAGLRFIGTLDQINDSLDNLEGASSDYAQQQNRILQLNKELAAAQNELTKELSGGSQEFQSLFLTVKTLAFEGFTNLVRNLKFIAVGIANAVQGVRDFIGQNEILSATIGRFINFLFTFGTVFGALFRQDLPAIFAGFRAAVGQAVDNVRGFLSGLVLDAKIAGQQLNLALSIRSETKERIRQDIKALQDQRTEAAQSAKTIGEAFNEAFQAAIDARKIDATPVQQIQNNVKNLNDELSKTPAKINKVTKATEDAAKASDDLVSTQLRNIDAVGVRRAEQIDTNQQQEQDAINKTLMSFREANEKRIEETRKTNEEIAKLEAERRQANLNAGLQTAQTLADAAFQIATDRNAQQLDADLQALEQAEAEQLAQFEGNEAKQQEISKQFAAQREALEKQAAERDKKRAISQALLNGALAATTTLAQLGLPAAIPALITLAATIAAQVATISSQKFAAGGVLSGPSHAAGGIRGTVGGAPIELEGGEAVINKRSTAAFRPLLSAINEAGGGIRFQDGGIAGPPLPLPRLAALPGNNNAFIELAQALRAENMETRALVLAVRNQVITQRVVLDTEELDTVQNTRVQLDNARTL